MIVLFNAANNTMGGGIQTASNFIRLAIASTDTRISWHFLISTQIARNLESLEINPQGDPRFEIASISPARSRAARWMWARHINTLGPDVVYTMSGPAYLRVSVPHVMGCSNAYISHAQFGQYLGSGAKAALRKLLESAFKWGHIHRADLLVFQTESARDGFLRRSTRSRSQTSVIANALGRSFTELFSEPLSRTPFLPTQERPLSVLVPSAGYSHKNLDIILPTAKILHAMHPGLFRFVLTLPDSEVWRRISDGVRTAGLNDMVTNRGPFTVAEAPEMYRSSDLMFLPTRLETFSGSYLEAMWCGLPIITSNFGFARDICGPAALYVDSLSEFDCATAIARFLNKDGTFERLVSDGHRQVQTFPTLAQRYEAIVELLLAFTSQFPSKEKS
jgi:glycosyltransferase involved in cell wall biosynthesis